MKDDNPFSIPNRIDWLEGKVKEMTDEMRDEMRDLEERIARLEHNLAGIEIINIRCPKCENWVPIMKIMGHDPSKPIIRCQACMQRLVYVGGYEIKEE